MPMLDYNDNYIQVVEWERERDDSYNSTVHIQF